MAFDGEKFGKDIVHAVRSYVDREIEKASRDVTDVMKAYVDRRLAGDTKAFIKPRIRVPANSRARA